MQDSLSHCSVKPFTQSKQSTVLFPTHCPVSHLVVSSDAFSVFFRSRARGDFRPKSVRIPFKRGFHRLLADDGVLDVVAAVRAVTTLAVQA